MVLKLACDVLPQCLRIGRAEGSNFAAVAAFVQIMVVKLIGNRTVTVPPALSTSILNLLEVVVMYPSGRKILKNDNTFIAALNRK